MSTKVERQDAILRLVEEQHISTQTELAEALHAEGIEAVQTTISRDVARLGLVKVRNGDGRLIYALPGAGDARRLDLLCSALRSYAGAFVPTGALLVIHTPGASRRRWPTPSTRPCCPRSPGRSLATTPSSSPSARVRTPLSSHAT